MQEQRQTTADLNLTHGETQIPNEREEHRATSHFTKSDIQTDLEDVLDRHGNWAGLTRQ